MNPEVHSDCSGLFVNWWYCVGTKPESSLTLTWNPTTSKIDVPNPTSFTPSVTPTTTEPVTPTPFDSGMVKGCDGFYQASTSQNCQGILKVYSIISEKQLLDWNPGLKGDCNAFKSGYWYCVADFASMTFPLPSTTAGLPSPPAEGAYTKDCVGWYQVGKVPLTCDLLMTLFGTFSKQQFIDWNAVAGNCEDYLVCLPKPPACQVTSSTDTNDLLSKKKGTKWLLLHSNPKHAENEDSAPISAGVPDRGTGADRHQS